MTPVPQGNQARPGLPSHPDWQEWNPAWALYPDGEYIVRGDSIVEQIDGEWILQIRYEDPKSGWVRNVKHVFPDRNVLEEKRSIIEQNAMVRSYKKQNHNVGPYYE